MDPIKVVLLGDSGVGKTSLVQRFIYDKFKPDSLSTLGAMFIAKTLEIPEDSLTVRFNIWDTAGQEKYRSLAAMYYQDATVAIIVYDITKKATYEGAKTWLEEVRQRAPKEILLVLAANKSDLLEQEEVDPVTAKQFAEAQGLKFKLTSAKDGAGVRELFTSIAKSIFGRKTKKDDVPKPEASPTGHKLEVKNTQKKQGKSCC